MLRVRIAPLSDGLHDESLQPTAAELDVDPAVFSDIALDLRLDVRDRRVRAAYTVRATARLECDRTLDLYDEAVEGAHEMLYVPPGDPLAAASEADDMEVLTLDATHVDLSAPVRDTLLLSLPVRRVSPAARALDLPTAYGGPGEGEPADDRWVALEALRRATDGPADGDASSD